VKRLDPARGVNARSKKPSPLFLAAAARLIAASRRLSTFDKQSPHEVFGLLLDARMRTLPRTCHVENADIGFHEPSANVLQWRGPLEVHAVQGFDVPFGQMHRELRSPFKASTIQNERTVRVDHILLGTVRVIDRGVFYQLVAIGDPAVFGEASRGTPSAVGHAQGDGGVERTPIHAGLSTGHDALYAMARSVGTRVQMRLSG